MPLKVTWDDVKAKLAAVEKAGVYPPLDQALEQIPLAIASNEFQPEDVNYFIQMIEGMSKDFGMKMQQKGRKQALGETLNDAKTKFQQAGWHPNKVVNAENYFQFVMTPVAKEVEEPKQSVGIPVVLLVMNKTEAKELDSSKLPVDMPKNYFDEFQKLKKLLSPDWLTRYGKSPEEWKPFDLKGQTIGELMTAGFEEVRQNLDYQKKTIVPDFVDIRTLNSDRKTLTRLRQNGCFVINDVISLWHPEIQCQYRSSLLEAFPNTMIYRIVPLGTSGVSQPLVARVERYEDLEFFKRMKARDLRCRNFSECDDFTGFVVNFTPNLIPNDEKETSVVERNIVGGRSG